MVPPTRIELVNTGYQPIIIPFNYRGINFGLPCTIRTCSLLTPDQAVYQIDINER